MFAQQSLQDLLFLMLYGGAAMLALIAGLYLWLRRSNAIAPAVTPPSALRKWTVAFLVSAALSHVWWYVFGVYWLTDDRLVRNVIAVLLDHVTLVPLAMAMLLCMLQDRQRRLWPWFLAQVPVVVIAVVGIDRHDEGVLDVMSYWQTVLMVGFMLYYVRALLQYNRWLCENFADLEHKEVWQSLMFLVVIFIVYEVYSTNPGDMFREYLAQVNTIIIIAFLLWRVETLQRLDITADEMVEVGDSVAPEQEEQASPAQLTIPTTTIKEQLEKKCEARKLFLQHDLTLQQLAAAIGTNRTYLSVYFAQQGITYNAYINRLRIAHFMRIYRESMSTVNPQTATQLAKKSGFYSYSTFSSAFKSINNLSFAAWAKTLS